MMRSRTKSSVQVFDALSLTAEITTLGGSLRQMYYTTEEDFEDDRKWIPCILGGYVFVNDPSGVMSGEATLTDIEWYTQPPVDGDYATGRISNPSDDILNDEDVYDPETGELTHEAAWRSVDYLVSNGSGSSWCEDVANLCLIVHKNVPQLTSCTVYGVLKFLDTRTGLTVRVLKNVTFSTEAYDTDTTTMRGDCGAEVVYNPLSFTDTIPSGETILDIAWTRSIGVQLQGTEGDVADNEACYLWLIEDSDASVAPSGWREFNDEEKIVMAISGEQTKSLSFDARSINGSIALRCYGCRRDADADWSSPFEDGNPFYEVSVIVAIPGTTPGNLRRPNEEGVLSDIMANGGTFVAEPVQTTGNVLSVEMSTICTYEMRLRYNNVDVPTNKRCLFRFCWYGENLKTGAVNCFGYSDTLSFVPRDYGYSFPEGFDVWAEIESYNTQRMVVENGCYVVEDGKYVVCEIFG